MQIPNMRTREEYEEQVKGPGKFQGEEPWTPYFYDMANEGDGEIIYSDAGELSGVLFHIYSGDTELFPELNEYRHAVLVEDSQGFVWVKLFGSGEEVDKWAKDYFPAQEEDE
jgi:hypothetical protein